MIFLDTEKLIKRNKLPKDENTADAIAEAIEDEMEEQNINGLMIPDHAFYDEMKDIDDYELSDLGNNDLTIYDEENDKWISPDRIADKISKTLKQEGIKFSPDEIVEALEEQWEIDFN